MAVLLVLLAASAIRVRLLDMPLERDEGEYAYAGQLMLQGIPPYLLACNMKLPGIYAAYALLMAALGQTTAGIHLGLLLVNGGAIMLIALLGRRLFGAPSGVAAAAAYALMSLGPAVLGTQAHATHFVVVAALGGALLLVRYYDSPRIVTLCCSGLLFGIAFLMKQHGVFFAVFGLLCLAVTEWRRKRLAIGRLVVFGSAMAVPLAATGLFLWHAGVFARFWFWTFTYARAYVSEVPLSAAPTLFAGTFLPLAMDNAALLILAFAGLLRLWYTKALWSAAAFASALLLFSFLAICPGLYFRPHYFVLLLPAVALLAGASVRGRVSYCIFGVALLSGLITQYEFFFRLSPVEASRALYGGDPFTEAAPVARYIKTHSGATARIAVLGSEPEIYFYANRHSATSYLYMYGLTEIQPFALTMQEDMIREVTAAAPEFVVEVDSFGSWMPHEGAPSRIFAWWLGYRQQHYRLVGVAARVSKERTEYRWGAEAQGFQPRFAHLDVYQRTDAVPSH